MRVWDNFWKDIGGKTVIWQRPNLPLVVGLLAMVAKQVLPFGNPAYIAELIAYGALFTWGWLELFQGANYFRRLVGLVVLLMIMLSRI